MLHQLLLEAGAPKDLPNRIGWTALHEACFYNRVETVKTLLLSGADATLRTRLGGRTAGDSDHAARHGQRGGGAQRG